MSHITEIASSIGSSVREIYDYDQIDTRGMSGGVWGQLADDCHSVFKNAVHEIDSHVIRSGAVSAFDSEARAEFHTELVTASIAAGAPKAFAEKKVGEILDELFMLDD